MLKTVATTLARWTSSATRNSVIHATGINLVIVGITTIAGIVIARTLGAEGRGYYAAIMAWFALAQVLGELGQSGAVTFWVSKDPLRGKVFVASSRWIMITVGGVVSIAGILTADFLAQGHAGVGDAYRIAFLGCFLNSLCAASIYGLQAVSLRRWNLVRLAQPVAYIAIVIGFALSGILDIVWLSLALILSVLVQLLFAVQQAKVVGLARGKPTRAAVVALTRYGVAYTGSALPAAASGQFDKVVLAGTVNPSLLGEYAVASSVASLAYPVSTAVSSVVFPKTASAQMDETGRRRLEFRALTGIAIVSVLMSAVIAVGLGPLIPLIFGDEFTGSVALVWWIVPAILFRSVSQVMSALLRGRGLPGLITYGQLAGLIVGASTIFPLISSSGLQGAALAFGLGEAAVLTVVSVFYMWARRRAAEHERQDANAIRRRSRPALLDTTRKCAD